MHEGGAWRCCLVVAIAAALAALGLTTCDRPTPMEPSLPRAFETHVSIATTRGVPSNTITVSHDGCDCGPDTVIIRIDGVEVGTMGCIDTQSFILAPGRHTLAVVSHQGAQSVEMSISGEGLGLLAVITCHGR